jgi:hypothetical protein
MKLYGWCGGMAPPLDGGEWSACGMNWLRGYVVTRAGMNTGLEKSLVPLPGIEPWPSGP